MKQWNELALIQLFTSMATSSWHSYTYCEVGWACHGANRRICKGIRMVCSNAARLPVLTVVKYHTVNYAAKRKHTPVPAPDQYRKGLLVTIQFATYWAVFAQGGTHLLNVKVLCGVSWKNLALAGVVHSFRNTLPHQ